MLPRHILIVDDEPDICEILRFNLATAGYVAEVAYSAEEALQHDLSQVDLLLLDVMMAGMSGFEMAKQVDVPVIFLTAKNDEPDILRGFALGADDYISKPFSVREVLARVKAVLSRTESYKDYEHESHNTLLSVGGLSIDTAAKSATADGVPLALTKTEFELLSLLISEPGRVFSRQELMDLVWPGLVVTTRTVDVNITRLRKKLGSHSALITSRQGYGYTLESVK